MVKRKKKSTVTASSCETDKEKLPLLLKNKFGQLGFVKWTCSYSPVLIVDPMQMVLAKCLPEGIYHAWLYKVHLYYNLGKNHGSSGSHSPIETAAGEASLDALPVLIYWYGTSFEFSIVKHKQVMSWEEGCQYNNDAVPEFMYRRITELRRPVPAIYSLIYEAVERWTHSALNLEPEERSLKILPSRKKGMAVLNEWHALATESPPQQYAWLEQKNMLEPELPHRDLFGKVAFLPRQLGGGRTYHHPVLILSPFRLPPGPMRMEWFSKCSSGRMVMVYWMGSYTIGRLQHNVYTVHQRDELVAYEEGKRKRYHRLPKEILNDYGETTLSTKRLGVVDFWVCAKWELDQALERNPPNRWGGLEDFEEDHDDDFDFYWDCINAAKEAVNAAQDFPGRKRKGRHQQTASRQCQRSGADQSRAVLEFVGITTSSRGVFEDSSSDGEHKDGRRAEQDGEFLGTPEKNGRKKKSSASRKLPFQSPGANRPLEQRLKLSLRDAPEDEPIKTDESLVLPVRQLLTVAAQDQMPPSPTSSDKDIDDQMKSSLLGCAAFLQEESEEMTIRRQKRKATGMLLSPSDTISSGLATQPPDRILELKRRKQETQQVVHDAIKHWSQKSGTKGITPIH